MEKGVSVSQLLGGSVPYPNMVRSTWQVPARCAKSVSEPARLTGQLRSDGRPPPSPLCRRINEPAAGLGGTNLFQDFLARNFSQFFFLSSVASTSKATGSIPQSLSESSLIDSVIAALGDWVNSGTPLLRDSDTTE